MWHRLDPLIRLLLRCETRHDEGAYAFWDSHAVGNALQRWRRKKYGGRWCG